MILSIYHVYEFNNIVESIRFSFENVVYFHHLKKKKIRTSDGEY